MRRYFLSIPLLCFLFAEIFIRLTKPDIIQPVSFRQFTISHTPDLFYESNNATLSATSEGLDGAKHFNVLLLGSVGNSTDMTSQLSEFRSLLTERITSAGAEGVHIETSLTAGYNPRDAIIQAAHRPDIRNFDLILILHSGNFRQLRHQIISALVERLDSDAFGDAWFRYAREIIPHYFAHKLLRLSSLMTIIDNRNLTRERVLRKKRGEDPGVGIPFGDPKLDGCIQELTEITSHSAVAFASTAGVLNADDVTLLRSHQAQVFLMPSQKDELENTSIIVEQLLDDVEFTTFMRAAIDRTRAH